MSLRNILLIAAAMLVACAAQAATQQSLGDLVSENGYDWLIGKWAATTNEGEQIEFEYKWGLDKHIVLADLKMGDFKYHGIIMLVPAREEVIQVGADNKGGIWKGAWSGEDGKAVHRTEHTRPDGETRKADIVHAKADADTMKVATYGVDSSGQRASEPWGTVTYKRQTTQSPAK